MSARSTGVSPRISVRTPAERIPGTAPSRSLPSRPELRLVAGEGQARPRRPVPVTTSRRTPFVLLVVALLVGTTLGLLVLNTAIAVDSLKATALRSANAQRSQEVQRLQRQVVTAGTPEQVAADATKAGLVPAGQPGFLVIGPDGRSTLRGAPQAAPRPPAAPASTAKPALKTAPKAGSTAAPATAKASSPAPAGG